MENPVVSVICLTYNIEEYIAGALDSILMQKTNFPFEVIVHDDASTDRTADIIREYAEKYPDIIVPILQTENKFSQHISISRDIVFPAVRGKYTAYCEGDDYWTDPDKLQKQYDFMEANPDYTLCCGAVRQINCADPSDKGMIVAPLGRTGEVTVERLLGFKEKQPLCTCSMFFRTDVMLACPEEFPTNGERVKTLWLGLNGKIWHINDEMGVYRRGRPGSWTDIIWKKGRNEKKIRIYNQRINMYRYIDNYSGGKYNESFQEFYLTHMKLVLRSGAKLREIKKGDVKEVYESLSAKRKRTIALYSFLLPLMPLASKIKKAVKKK